MDQKLDAFLREYETSEDKPALMRRFLNENREYSFSSWALDLTKEEALEKENPLLVIARENGAYKAILDSLEKEISYYQEPMVPYVEDLLHRILDSFSLHLEKLELFSSYFPFDSYQKKILSLQKREEALLLEAKDGKVVRESLASYIEKRRERIKEENCEILPLLEEKVDPVLYPILYRKEKAIGFALIKE